MSNAIERVWQKATEDESFRQKLIQNPVTVLKAEGVQDVPEDLQISVENGQVSFSTSDELALDQLNARVTKSK